MNHFITDDLATNVSQRLWRNEQGQNIIEFALAIVILLILTLGMIDFGRAVYTKSVIEAASQEGARTGIVNILDSGAVDLTATESAVRTRMFGLDTENVAIDIVQSSTDVVDVTVTYNFRFVTPMVGTMLNAERGVISLMGQASMVAQ